MKTVQTSRPKRSASVVTATASKSPFCCNCFGPLKSQWDDVISNQMSDVYCRTCEDDNYDDQEHNDGEFVRIPKDRLDSPAILTNVTQRKNQRNKIVQSHKKSTYLSVSSDLQIANMSIDTKCDETNADNINKNPTEEYEFGDDVVTNEDEIPNANSNSSKIPSNPIDTNEMIRVRGKEELPVSTESIQVDNHTISKHMPKKVICTDDHPLMDDHKDQSKSDCENSNMMRSMTDSMASTPEKVSILKRMHRMYSTLPKIKKTTPLEDTAKSANRPPFSIPTRTTADGTTIYYLCDLSKNVIKGGHTIYH